MVLIAKETATERSAQTEGEWGRLFVTRRCLGAGTCRNYAPQLLGEIPPRAPRPGALPVLADSFEPGAFTGVIHQPQSADDASASRAAAASCPFGAIRYRKQVRRTMRTEGSVWAEWPRRIEENVWALGRPSARNLGAMTYFVELQGGGVLIEPPKPTEEMFDWLEQHGGVRWLFITHRDHAHHHADFAARFPGCVRIVSALDVIADDKGFLGRTDNVEVQLPETSEPMNLDGSPLARELWANADFVVLPQPGHTPGSVCLLYRGRFLFTGDHLFHSQVQGHVIAPRLQCWQDWAVQTQSVEKLVSWAEQDGLRFQWILPAHSDWVHLDGDGSAQRVAAELRRTVAWMKKQPAGHTPMFRFYLFFLSRTKTRTTFMRLVRAIRADALLLPRALRRYVPR